MGRGNGRVMVGIAVIVFGIGTWMVLAASPALGLADTPGGWLLAVAAPIAGLAVAMWQRDRVLLRRERARAAARDAGVLEQELLAALAAHGALTPSAAALRTSLTLDEAGSLLEAIASMGTVLVIDGVGGRAYGLVPVTDAVRLDAGASMPDEAGSAPDGRVSTGATLAADPLSDRELDVLALAATGRTNREIADALALPVGAVGTLTSDISRKLGVRTRSEAITRARLLALV